MTLHKATFNWRMLEHTIIERSTLSPPDLCKKIIENTNAYERTTVHNLLDYYLKKNNIKAAAKLCKYK